ncbi:MAG: DUF87 domain-containing protein [Desulfurococcaceae archaeon]|uniref:DUF87 domain-containing protein n=1 Tax=Staphylothermus marinus TaxID=2280 RepID=A0A7C4NMB9_STAMA
MLHYFVKPIVEYPVQFIVESINDEYVEIGNVINSIPPVKAKISVNSLVEHVFVTGSTGSGKTRTVAKIVNELNSKKHDLSIIVIDWHDEYSKLVSGEALSPYSLPVNIIDSKDPYSFVDLLIDVLELSGPQVYVLERVVRRYRDRISDLDSLIKILENDLDESSWMRESRYSILRKLYPLTRPDNANLFTNNAVHFSEQNLFRGTTIIRVSEIRDPLVKKTYVALLLKTIFNSLRNRRGWRTLVVLEEAQNFLSRDKPINLIASLLAEVRKFNMGLIVVSQSPSRLLEDAMINTNTKIIHSIKSSIDLEIICKVLYLPFEYQKIIPYLDVGEAIVYTRGLKKPVIVRVE